MFIFSILSIVISICAFTLSFIAFFRQSPHIGFELDLLKVNKYGFECVMLLLNKSTSPIAINKIICYQSGKAFRLIEKDMPLILEPIFRTITPVCIAPKSYIHLNLRSNQTLNVNKHAIFIFKGTQLPLIKVISAKRISSSVI